MLVFIQLLESKDILLRSENGLSSSFSEDNRNFSNALNAQKEMMAW